MSQIATFIPGEAEAESRVTTIRRWLKNLRVDGWKRYRPVLERVLQSWHAFEVTVVLDGVMVFGDCLRDVQRNVASQPGLFAQLVKGGVLYRF